MPEKIDDAVNPLAELTKAVGRLTATVIPDFEVARATDEAEVDWLARLIGAATAGAAAQIGLASDLAPKLDARENENATLIAERDQLKAALDKAVSAAASAAKVIKSAAPKKPRKVGVLKGNLDAERLPPAELLELVQAASNVLVVFSDGRAEIAGIPALEISGNAWAVKSHGLALVLPELIVNGPAPGSGPYPLAGYGLFLDGELVAYQARPDVLQIGAGQRMNLKDDIIFAG